MQKTSIRFFEDTPIRAVWDEVNSKWWFSPVDIITSLKRRKSELFTNCKQLKLKASDGNSKNKAYELYKSNLIDDIEVGTLKGYSRYTPTSLEVYMILPVK